MVTDSAAAGTALATGHKTKNGMLGITPDGKPVGTILEAAKLNGFKTALVVTSIINHATPAAYSAHITDRNDFPSIAAQQIGYSHPLNQSVDILLGGGRCYFKPNSDSESCREDNVDLFGFAKKNGYYVAQNRSQFDDLEGGRGDIRLPFIGLFNDGDLSYEADRKEQPEDESEPSLSEMSETALHALHRATNCKKKGYFMMIEASRIDHASHAHDANAHLWDVLEYNKVIEVVTKWIDEHPDTAMISVADHETGGLTLPSGYDPRVLKNATHSIDYLSNLWDKYDGDNLKNYLVDEILPKYGLADATSEEIEAILDGNFAGNLADFLSERADIAWSTGGHTGVDVTLYAYAKGDMGEQLKEELAGSWDNTELPKYLEEVLDVDLDKVTGLIRENW